ncbi:MAG: hypothetical protein KJZ78_30115, partial [Bryobacteraceae bacterium]|nr:hypothetical protein [Bryobacteraceae bacterium]
MPGRSGEALRAGGARNLRQLNPNCRHPGRIRRCRAAGAGRRIHTPLNDETRAQIEALEREIAGLRDRESGTEVRIGQLEEQLRTLQEQ